MGRIVILGLLAVLAVWWFFPRKIHPWDLELTAASQNADIEGCFAKKRCVIAYLAPWCPYCHSCVPAVKQLVEENNRSGDIGMIVVVGMDKRDKLEAMAQEIGPNAFLDLNNNTYRKMKLRGGLPSWIGIDSTYKVIAKANGAPAPCTPDTLKRLLQPVFE